MFIYVDRGYVYVIPDDILESDEKLYEFFKQNHNIIIGPKMNGLGEYIDRGGTWRDGLDIFGNLLTEWEQQYHNNNKFHIDGEEYFKRTVCIRDTESYYDPIHLSVFPKKVKHLISNHDEEYEIDGLDLLFDEDGNPEDVVFVRDMMDNTTIISEIEKYIAEQNDIWEEDVILKIDENYHFQKVPYKNAIKFSIARSL
jgi:hypothetical protein